MAARRTLILLATALVALFASASQALATPGAYKILLAEAYPEQAKKLADQLSVLPEVATIDFADTEAGTPSAAQLAPYDLVVSIGDSSYDDPEAWGDSLASYVDVGGVVVQSAYDNWENGFPSGRFASGGYAPFVPGNNGNNTTSLGNFNAASPLMQGVTALTTELNTEPELAPGATLIADWANGKHAIAQKGHVVSITAFIGDHYGEVWTGDYGRIAYNAMKTFGRQALSVVNTNPAGGTVTSNTGGINCGAVCRAIFAPDTPVVLGAVANKGFAFSGFGGSCTGLTCVLTMSSGKSVTAGFTSFGFGKVKRNERKGTAQISINLGGPGQLVLSGKKVKKKSKSVKGAGKATVVIVAKGKAAATLRKSGKVKVKLQLAFTPPGGTAATLSKTVKLKLAG